MFEALLGVLAILAAIIFGINYQKKNEKLKNTKEIEEKRKHAKSLLSNDKSNWRDRLR